jgi:hypothetical protein
LFVLLVIIVLMISAHHTPKALYSYEGVGFHKTHYIFKTLGGGGGGGVTRLVVATTSQAMVVATTTLTTTSAMVILTMAETAALMAARTTSMAVMDVGRSQCQIWNYWGHIAKDCRNCFNPEFQPRGSNDTPHWLCSHRYFHRTSISHVCLRVPTKWH